MLQLGVALVSLAAIVHAYQCVAVVVYADAVPAHPTMLLQDFSLGQQQRTQAESEEALNGHDDEEFKPVGPITKDPDMEICLTLNNKGRKTLKRAMRVESVDVKGRAMVWKGRALGVVQKPVASAAATEQPDVPPVVGSKANAPHAAPFPLIASWASADPSVASTEMVPVNQVCRKRGGKHDPKPDPKLCLKRRLLLARSARWKYAAVSGVTKQVYSRRFLYSLSMLKSGKLYGRRLLRVEGWLEQCSRKSGQKCDEDGEGAASNTAFDGGLRTRVVQIGWQAKNSYVHKWKVQARLFGRVAMNVTKQQLKWEAQARQTLCALLGRWSSKVYWLKLKKFRLTLCFKRLQKQHGTRCFTQMVRQHKVIQLLRNRARFNRFIQELLFDPGWADVKWKADNRWMQREAAAVKIQVAVRVFIAKRVSNKLQRVNSAPVQQHASDGKVESIDDHQTYLKQFVAESADNWATPLRQASPAFRLVYVALHVLYLPPCL